MHYISLHVIQFVPNQKVTAINNSSFFTHTADTILLAVKRRIGITIGSLPSLKGPGMFILCFYAHRTVIVGIGSE